jgi:hypothetical protein
MKRHAPEEFESAGPLFDSLTPEQRERTIRAEFQEFNAAHPEVYAMFERFALEALRFRRVIGAKAVWERMRWETSVGSEQAEDFRLNNNFTAYYSRLFMERHPEHVEAFETRAVAS